MIFLTGGTCLDYNWFWPGHQQAGARVICGTWALRVAVIPAKAGIHSANLREGAADGLDSRFRGNDWRVEGDPYRAIPTLAGNLNGTSS